MSNLFANTMNIIIIISLVITVVVVVIEAYSCFAANRDYCCMP